MIQASASTPAPARPFKSMDVLRHASHYLGASYISRALCAIRAFINARWLGPELYGFWGSLMLLVSFGFYLHGGAQEIMVKRIPRYLSRHRADLARQTTQLVFTFFSAMLLVGSLALWAMAWWLPAGTPVLIRLGWVAAGVVLPLEVLFDFEQMVVRAEERFALLSRGLLLANVLSLLLTCWLVVSYGLAGLLVVAVATPAIGLWYFRVHSDYRWRPRWSWRQLRPMLQSGWPILVMTLVFYALAWIDRVLVLGFIGMTGFGYYSIGVMVAQLCFVFPERLAAVVEPKLHFDYARHQRVSAIEDHVWLPLKALAYLMPLGLGLLDLILPVVISLWLPAYIPGIPTMRILVWGVFFMGLAVSPKALIVTLGQQRRVLPIYGIAIAVNLAISLALLLQGWGLVGIAVGTVIAHLVNCTGLLIFTFRRLEWPLRIVAARIAELYLPCVLVWALALGVSSSVGYAGPGAVSDVLRIFWAVGLVVCTGVVGLQLWRRIRVEARREEAG